MSPLRSAPGPHSPDPREEDESIRILWIAHKAVRDVEVEKNVGALARDLYGRFDQHAYGDRARSSPMHDRGRPVRMHDPGRIRIEHHSDCAELSRRELCRSQQFRRTILKGE